MSINFAHLFSGSFETYKALGNLKPEDTGDLFKEAPVSLWQLLNHLIRWQEHQLHQLQQLRLLEDQDQSRNIGSGYYPPEEKPFGEAESWISEKQAPNQQILDQTIALLNQQIDRFEQEIKNLNIKDPLIGQKLPLIQQAAQHLSFHLGEIIFLRRLSGQYPLTHQMQKFLKEEK